MIRRYFVLAFYSAPAACLACAASLVRSLIVAPIMYLIRQLSLQSLLSILPTMKLIAFRKISQLKPVYYLSYLTNGLSLRQRRCTA